MSGRGSPAMAEPISGILAIDKPRGMTSHDVVARIRRLTGQRRAGHAGTLDPLATGVLLVCLGAATRMSAELMGGRKWYLARIAFGARTDTDDADGRMPSRTPDSALNSPCRLLGGELRDALERQLGMIQQVPPQFAAIKQSGVPAYRQARSGQAVSLDARAVVISALATLGIGEAEYVLEADGGPRVIRAPHADVLIACSKGTYVRSIARDVGEAVGTGAFVAALRRLASGGFTTRRCVTLEHVEEAVARGGMALHDLLYPVDVAVAETAAAVLGAHDERRARAGAVVHLEGSVHAEALRLYSASGEFLGLASPRAGGTDSRPHERGAWHPDRVFAREG